MAVRVGRVAFALFVTLVKGQKECALARQLGRHEHLVSVHGHMHKRAAKLQKRLGRVAVFAVLLLPVIAGGLVGPGVFQLQRDQGHSVQEKHHVDLLQRIGLRIAHLPHHAEQVRVEVFVHLS